MARIGAGACACGLLAGVSAWIALGVTSGVVDAESARTIGLLPPVSHLAALIAAGIAAAMASTRRLPCGLIVLALLATTAVWLPLPLRPWMATWSSPASLPIFVLLSATLVMPRAIWNQARLGPWFAACLAALWLGSISLALGPRGISGDEPHYLLIAQSVWKDGDFDLRNNYDARDLLAYYAGSLEPRHVSLGVLGQEYSFHGPGVALLSLPAFVLGGPLAARLLIAMLVASSSGLLWLAVRRLSGSTGAAWIGWLAFVVGSPLALNASMIYPDGPGAAICALAFWALVRVLDEPPRPSLAMLAAVGLALALLPWLHLRLALVSASFGAAFIVALRRSPDAVTRVLWFLAAPAVACALLIASTWVMFGWLDPTAVFRQQAAGSLAAAPAGMLGLLFDQEFGLLPYASYYALAPLGLLRLSRRAPLVAVTAIVVSAGTLIVGASWVWWGGQSAPARFLVPALPALAIGVAMAWASGGHVLRSLLGVALATGASLTMLTATADGGAYAINHPDGHATVFEWLSASIDLSSALPSLFRFGATPGSELSVALIWLGWAAFAALALTLYARGRPSSPGLSSAVGVSMAACSFAAAQVWASREVSPWTSDRAQLAILAAGGRNDSGPALMSPGPRVVPRTDLFSSLSISAPRSDPPAALLHVPMLPAGRYRIELEPGSSTSPQPTLELALGLNAWPLETWTAADDGPTFVTAFPAWAARVTSAEGHATPTVRLRPLDVRSSPSADDALAWHVTPYGPLVVYSLDRSSMPERGGLWLGADRESVLAVSDRQGHAQPVRWLVEAGPAPVVLEATDDREWTAALTLDAGQRGTMETPTGVLQPVPIRFVVRGGFSAPDGRRLGVWVSVEPR